MKKVHFFIVRNKNFPEAVAFSRILIYNVFAGANRQQIIGKKLRPMAKCGRLAIIPVHNFFVGRRWLCMDLEYILSFMLVLMVLVIIAKK